VHRATLATHLRTTPPRAKQPPDAPMTCPKGAGPVRVLFDSEKGGAPATKFDAGSTWLRAPTDPLAIPAVDANAVSGRGSWFSFDPDNPPTVSSLVMHPVALPAGHRAYLWFQQWRLLDFGPSTGRIFDGGTVEVADTTSGTGPKHAERLPWVNGPHDVIYDLFSNPAAGRVSFGADSRGYLASRLSLKRYAGHAVAPQFTMNTDTSVGLIGWYLDDVRVYTCGRGPVPRSAPSITGAPTAGSTLIAEPGQWSPSRVQGVQWYAGGVAIAGATGTSYVVRPADAGKRISVKVTATAHQHHTSTFSTATAPVG
jgi:bacillolysin